MAKIECDAKKRVAKYLNYGVNEKELVVVWSNEIGVHAQVMLKTIRTTVILRSLITTKESALSPSMIL